LSAEKVVSEANSVKGDGEDLIDCDYNLAMFLDNKYKICLRKVIWLLIMITLLVTIVNLASGAMAGIGFLLGYVIVSFHKQLYSITLGTLLRNARLFGEKTLKDRKV